MGKAQGVFAVPTPNTQLTHLLRANHSPESCLHTFIACHNDISNSTERGHPPTPLLKKL